MQEDLSTIHLRDSTGNVVLHLGQLPGERSPVDSDLQPVPTLQFPYSESKYYAHTNADTVAERFPLDLSELYTTIGIAEFVALGNSIWNSVREHNALRYPVANTERHSAAS